MDACGSACRSGERICEPERQIIFRVPNGYIVDEKGIDLALVKQLKEIERRRIKDYVEYRKHARYVEGGNIWEIPFLDAKIPMLSLRHRTSLSLSSAASTRTRSPQPRSMRSSSIPSPKTTPPSFISDTTSTASPRATSPSARCVPVDTLGKGSRT